MALYSDVWFESSDGLKLYARDYNAQAPAGKCAVLCLAGLTRNCRDFEPLIPHIAGQRRVIAMDYRGRGRSANADDWNSYHPSIEAADTLRLLDHLAVPSVAIIGTSRGGIVAMVMAAQAIDRIAGVLFNDIGPVIDAAGLLRIRHNLDEVETISSWAGAIARLKATNPGYETLSDEQWERMARAIFRDMDGQPVLDFDARLGLTFPSAEDITSGKLPPAWGLFDLLKDVPVSVLRGEHSDLLSVQTVAEMAAHHPGLDATTVRNRGHIPLLDEPESLAAVRRWLALVDAR